MKQISLFQIIVLGVFVAGVIVAIIVIATTKASEGQNAIGEVNMWGSLDTRTFNTYLAALNNSISDKSLRLRINYSEKDSNTIENELLEAIAEGRAPDIMLLPLSSVFSYYNRLWPIPYDYYPERQFLDTFVEGAELFKFNAGIAAMPFTADPMVMYWNRDIFTNAGLPLPPAYWNDFPGLSKILTKKDDELNIIQSLVALGEYRNIDNAKDIISLMLLQQGNPIISFNGGGTSVIERTDAGNTLSFFVSFANPTSQIYSWNRALPIAKEYFLQGKLGIYLGYASEAKELRSKNPNLNFDVALLPQLQNATRKITYSRLYGVGILKSSARIEDALKTILLLVEADSMSLWTANSGMPPVRRDLLTVSPPDKFSSLLYNSVLLSRGWLDPKPVETNAIFFNLIENITAGKQGVAEALRRASSEMTGIIPRIY